ncbi:MAG: UPF0149 family protein [Bacteriovoracaceae bacterium]|jgi:uncharacterized protein|nr:UPF0149 family protein [Bacteriovoracaceae bacterium]
METPLSETEYDKLESILDQFEKENVMNLEAVDGLFTALICSPEMTQPNIYLRAIWGDKGIPANELLQNDQDTQDFMFLLMRHWNAVVRKLDDDEVFLPVLFEDSDGNAKGNDWAKGFVRGMQIHKEDWAELSDDEENGGSLVPIMALAHEHNPDPEMRTYKEPVNAERREQLIAGLSAGAMNIYKYFEPHRRMSASTGNTFRRDTPKVGRNEPCPCGSGRKYKRCCGDVTLN